MEIKLKENIVFDSINDYTELQQKVISFIFAAKTDKILYKGDPKLIEYKLLKKILPTEPYKEIENKTISSYVKIGTDIRETF